jgi:hypothetical protein
MKPLAESLKLKKSRKCLKIMLDKSVVGPNQTCARKLTFILLLWVRIFLGVGTSCQQ